MREPSPIPEDDILTVKRLFTEALPKFNWGASALDANAIDLLNRAPAAFNRIILYISEHCE